MRTRRNFLVFAAALLVVLGLALLLRPQAAQRTVFDNGVIFTSDYHLSDTHSGDLVVIGASIVLEQGSQVAGDTSLVGQTLQVGGTVGGDLTMLGQNLVLDPTAQIKGDVNLSGENVTIDGQITGDLLVNGKRLNIMPGAVISGNLNVCSPQVEDHRITLSALSCTTSGIDPFGALIALRNTAIPQTVFGGSISPFGMLALTVFGSLALMGTSVLAVTFFPRRISHIEEAMRARPRSFVGVGIASYALIIGLFFALTFLLAIFPPLGLLLVPLFLIIGLLLFILSLTGLVTLAVMLGDWLVNRSSRHSQPPLVAAVVGSLALSLVLAGISLLPFGFVISFVLLGAVSSVGLGASLFTRIGTRPVGRTYFVQG